MTAVVTAASIVGCGHAGTVTVAGSPTLTVAGSPVLVAAGIVGGVVAHCATPTVTTSPPSSPCTSVVSVTPGPSLATKLMVGGAPVVLATLAGTTDGVVAGVTPQLLLQATVTQTLLTAT